MIVWHGVVAVTLSSGSMASRGRHQLRTVQDGAEHGVAENLQRWPIIIPPQPKAVQASALHTLAAGPLRI